MVVGHKRKPALITDVKVEGPGLNLTYPKVSGLKHKSAESGINRYIKKVVHQILKDHGYGSDENKKFTGGYTVKLNRRGTVSILIDIYFHEKGEAHGCTIRKTVNVSLKDARVYNLEDLFSRKVRKSKCLADINECIRAQITARAIKLQGEFETVTLKQDYYLTEDMLVIYFQQSEITPLEFGFPEFIIPFSEILDIVNSKGPIGRLLRDKEENEENEENDNNEETADE